MNNHPVINVLLYTILQENPVGSGTGKYQDRRLFIAKQGHASLVPVMGLIKYEEFYGLESKTIEGKGRP